VETVPAGVEDPCNCTLAVPLLDPLQITFVVLIEDVKMPGS
jgi:hypothetical protein